MSEAAATRFAVDGMLLRLGRLLRCLGHDTSADPRLPTRALARRAAEEGRVLLTRNARAAREGLLPGPHLVLAADEPYAQLEEVRGAYELARDRAFTRCLACNAPLEEVEDPAEVRAHVPTRVAERHERFFRCPRCDEVHWRGGHVVRTCARLGVPVPASTLS